MPIQVHKIMGKLKNDKAIGIHQLPNKLLKVSEKLFSSYLRRIFNQCIQKNIFPDDFKVRCVAPIFKSGDKEDLTITDPSRYSQQLHEFLKSCYVISSVNISRIMRF